MHLEIFNKTQHDMIWHDIKKKTRKMRLKSYLSWFFHQNLWDFYGISCGLRGAKEDRKTSEKMPPPGLLKHQPPQFGRWIFGGSVDWWTEDGRFFWKIFVDFFLKCWENHGKPKFFDGWFLNLPKTNDIQRPTDVDFTWWQPPSIFGGFKGIQPALPLRWPPAFFGGHR